LVVARKANNFATSSREHKTPAASRRFYFHSNLTRWLLTRVASDEFSTHVFKHGLIIGLFNPSDRQNERQLIMI
jgi:hypothetical protein